MKILVCGSRNWNRRKPIWEALTQVRKKKKGVLVINGAAPGADTIAGETAWELGFEVRYFPADWNRYGKKAGPLRNQKMIDEKPDAVLAFTEDSTSSQGTADTIRRAKEAGIPVFVYPKTKNWYKKWKALKS